MSVRDFTLAAYREVLTTALGCGYSFHTHADFAREGVASEQFILLRHDVDRLPKRAVTLAELEHDLGISSTFYFRTKPVSFDRDCIARIQDMGHEVGYHYENLADFDGDTVAAWSDFQESLKRFEPFGGVSTVSMHGRPMSGWDNRDLWDHYSYTDLGVSFEPYLDMPWNEVAYFTDTGRNWCDSYNNKDRVSATPEWQSSLDKPCSSKELAAFLREHQHSYCISLHPERWTDQTAGWLAAWGFDSLVRLAKTLRGAKGGGNGELS